MSPGFFIVGSARSGTTMLRLMMNAHPEVAVPPESRFIVELWRGRDVVEVGPWLDELARHERFRAWELPAAAVRAELEGHTGAPYAVATEAAYRAYARARSKDRCGDKTPRYIEHIPFLAGLFPESRFIHLVRDGRNVALSYAGVPFGPKTVAAAAALWSKRVTAGMEAGRALPDDRYMEIRYEDLVSGEEGLARGAQRLCRFLHLEFATEMLDYGAHAATDALPRSQRYNPHITDRPISATRAWQKEMPARHVEVFEAVAGPALSALGYERRHPAPGLGARAAAALGRAGLPVGRLRPEPAG
jgi:Sulfotransferase family